MAQWACSNPSCKAHGRAHKNCQCPPPAMYYTAGHAMMAEGGDVEDQNFCSQDNPHSPDCEYHTPPEQVLNPQEQVSSSLTAGANNLFAGGNFAKDVRSGTKDINSHIDSLFDDEPGPVPEPDEGARDKLNDYIVNGGAMQNLQNLPAPTVPAVQNTLLSAAKSNVSNYLNSQRPSPPVGQMAFDDKEDNPTQLATYHRALDVANEPLSVLQHIKAGIIEAEQIKHLTSMYPELTNTLQKKITDRIVKAQMEGTKPSYVVRQGLSALMGTPLDSTLTPSMMQAAQAVFAQQQSPASSGSPKKNKKSTSTLTKVGQQYATPEQSTQMRQQSDKN